MRCSIMRTTHDIESIEMMWWLHSEKEMERRMNFFAILFMIFVFALAILYLDVGTLVINVVANNFVLTDNMQFDNQFVVIFAVLNVIVYVVFLIFLINYIARQKH